MWCATLTVQSLSDGRFGCATSQSGKECASHFTVAGFTYDSTGNAVRGLQVTADGALWMFLSADMTTATQSLVLVVGSKRFPFAHGDTTLADRRLWSGSGLSWSSGDSVDVRLVEATASDATLSDLEIEEGNGSGNAVALSPPFAADETDYTGSVTDGVFQITVTAMASDASAKLEYLDRNGNALTDADTVAMGHQVVLDAGETVVQVQVTAEDGTTMTYRASVMRMLTTGATVLVANFAETLSMVVTDRVIAQSFTTGSNPGGYRLTGVVLRISSHDAGVSDSDTHVTIWSSQNGPPYEKIAELTSPPLGNGIRTYAAPAGVFLEPETPYHVMTNYGHAESSRATIRTTNSDRETSGYGWTIANGTRINPNSWTGVASSVSMKIEGEELPRCTIGLGGRSEIWSGEVTVGESVALAAYGFGDADNFGALSDVDFDLGSTTGVAISGIRVGDDGTLSFTSDLPAADHPALRLHVCRDTFDLADGAVVSGARQWASSGLDWSTEGTVSVALSASSDTALSGLTLSDGTLAPVFVPDTFAYEASVPNATARITVGPAVNERGAIVTFLNDLDAPLDDADGTTGGHQVDLAVGANVVKVAVTSGDRTTTQTYSVTVTRAAVPGVTVSETAVTVTEEDATGGSYTVVLDSEPTADVVVTVAGHASTAVTVSPDSLTFTDTTWDTEQTVTVTAGDDADTADETVELTHTAVSTDSGYGGIAIPGVAVTVEDNDGTPTTDLVWSTTMTVAEATFSLNSWGYGEASGSNDFGALGESTFTYESMEYKVAHLFAGDETGTINDRVRFVVNSSSGGVLPSPSGLILEFAGAVLSLDDATRSDGNKTYTWHVDDGTLPATSPLHPDNVRTTIPVDAMVQVCLRTATQVCPGGGTTTSNDATLSGLALADSGGDTISLGETFVPATTTYTASVANGIDTVTLTATKNDSNATVVIASDDNTGTPGVAELDLIVGSNTLTVTVTAQDGTTTQPYTITVTRAGAPGVTVSETALMVTEQDSTGNSYTVVLDTEPTADVTVTVAGHAGTAVTPDPATLTFTASNWSTVQTVTVTAGDDADTTDDTVALTHSAASADSGYSGIAIPSVAVTVSDNDTAQVTGVTVDAGDARLVMNWTAVDNATGYKVQWKSGNQNYNTTNRQATVTPGTDTSVTITGLANGTEYTVRVSATRTDANDGPPSAEETGTPAVSTAPGVTVSTTALTVTEQDTTGGSYTVALDTEPTANVVVTVAGHSGTDVTPNPTTLTFTSTTWSTAQTVTVTAGDDADTTDDTVALTHSAASADSGYSGIAIAGVAVTVSDNDTAQVTGLTVTPGNAQLVMNWTAVDNATGYKVQWKSGSEGYTTNRQATVTSGSTTSHTITGLANGTEYTVQVSATRTGANDGPPSAEVQGTPAVPTAAGVTVSTTALTVTEQDSTGNSYTVVLDTEPTANVVVTVAGHSGTDVTANPTTLTFTSTTWSTAQTVTVTAGDDADTEDDSVALTHSAASTDSGYSGIAIAGVAVTVSDNDTAGICERTPAVIAAILNKISSVSDCANVTDTHLAAITGGLPLSNRNVTALAAGDFAGLGALTTLRLQDNALTTLPDGVFAGLDALTTLRLHDNALTTLPDGVFAGLDALTTLRLHDNALTTLPDGVFAPLTALTTLNLYNNALPTLPDGVFAGLDALTTLSLSNSGLATLPAGVFAPLTALTWLSLSDNDLTALPAGVFVPLTALTKLRLHNNALTALPAGVFAGLNTLTTLWLNDNALTALPAGVFAGLDMLTTLWLDDNALTALPDDVFEPLTALTELKLANNSGGPFGPEAVALPDDGTVSNAGGTVTLDGSGSNGGPWGTNVTYGWALTNPASGVAVTFDDDTSVTPKVTVTSLPEDTELTFTLTVTGRGGTNGIRRGTDTATVTATASPASDDATLESLTVSDGTSDLTLAPPFAPGTFAYAAEVANAVTMVTLTAETTDDGASVSAVTLAGTAIADNDFTDGIMVPSLLVGDNAIMVRVTVEDTSTTQTYEVTVTRATPPGVTVSRTALTVTEEDPTGGSYTVVLDSEPTATVTVTVAGHAGTDVTRTPGTLTFTTSNWDTAQTVTVTAGDDADTTDDSVTLTHSAASTDTGYSGIAIDEVEVTVSDNDTARVTGLTVTPGDARLAVNWAAVDNATGYKVQWKSGGQDYNTGDRQFTIPSGTTTSHTITSLANGTEYTVQVSATRTGANDGPPSAEVQGTPAVPTAAGVTVSKTALTVTEQDTTGGSYTVVLDSEPTATVTVTVAGHAGTDVTRTPGTLTFTTSNWDTAQTVTVTAGDDADTTDDSVTLTHSAASTDSGYSGITIAGVDGDGA